MKRLENKMHSPNAPRRLSLAVVLLAAGGVFALTMGTRQSLGLFLNTLNSTTGLGLASVSLAFAALQVFLVRSYWRKRYRNQTLQLWKMNVKVRLIMHLVI